METVFGKQVLRLADGYTATEVCHTPFATTFLFITCIFMMQISRAQDIRSTGRSIPVKAKHFRMVVVRYNACKLHQQTRYQQNPNRMSASISHQSIDSGGSPTLYQCGHHPYLLSRM